MQKMSVLQQFFYQVRGPQEGKKWVFLHGLMGFSANWLKIVSALQETERCLVFDQRGHGRSFHPESGFSPQDYARDLHDLSKALGWERFILVGHSMGARNALSFTHLFPEMVEKLVLEDLAVDLATEAPAYYQRILDAVPTPFPSREAAKIFFQEEFLHKAQFREGGPLMSQFFYANIKDLPDGRADWRFSRDGILKSVGRIVDKSGNPQEWAMIQNLTCPTLLVRGGRSLELSSESVQKILMLNPKIRAVEISNAGHWVHADQPQEFTDVLKDFVGVGKRGTLDSK